VRLQDTNRASKKKPSHSHLTKFNKEADHINDSSHFFEKSFSKLHHTVLQYIEAFNFSCQSLGFGKTCLNNCA
jgi:alpha/beta superfamily hydrolase